MAGQWSFVISSTLAASPEAVWTQVSTMEGVNDEFWPWMRMSCPLPRGTALDSQVVPLGQRLFRSWLLLFGVLPVDYDDITLLRVDRGRGFLESSAMLSQRSWRHERVLRPSEDGGGCVVEDRVELEPRAVLQPAGAVVRRIALAVFRWRHRRLRRRFGTHTKDGT